MAKYNESEPLLPDSSQEKSLNWFLIIFASANYFKWTLLYVAFIPNLPFYSKTFGLDGLQQSLLIASLQAGWLIAFPLLYLAPLRTRHVLYLGGTAYAVAPLLLGLASEVWMLFVARILEGFGSCLLMNICDAILARQTPSDQRGRAFGFQKAIGMTGLLYGPLASGVLLPAGGLILIMGIISVVGWVSMGLYYMAPEEWFAARDERINSSPREHLKVFSHICSNPQVVALLILQCSAFTMTGVFWVAMPQYAEGILKVSAFALSLLWISWDSFKFICSLLGGFLTDQLGAWLVMVIGLAIMGVASLLLGWFVSVSAGIVGIGLGGAMMSGMGGSGGGLVGPAFTKLLVEIEKNMGHGYYEEMLTVSFLTITLSIAWGNIYAGYVISSLGFMLTFVIFGAVELLTLVICGCLTKQLVQLG